MSGFAFYRSGDCIFHGPTPTGLGDMRIDVTDLDGVSVGHLYVDESDHFADMCDAWVTETEAPEGTE